MIVLRQWLWLVGVLKVKSTVASRLLVLVACLVASVSRWPHVFLSISYLAFWFNSLAWLNPNGSRDVHDKQALLNLYSYRPKQYGPLFYHTKQLIAQSHAEGESTRQLIVYTEGLGCRAPLHKVIDSLYWRIAAPKSFGEHLATRLDQCIWQVK